MRASPRRARPRRVAAAGLGAAALLAFALPALGLLGDSAGVGANMFGTATLQPPTGVSASASCVLLQPRVTVTWTATSSAFADGYDVYRGGASGGPYSFRAHVGLVTSWVDTGVSPNTTYFYVVRSTAQNWRSANSNQAQATTPLVCL